MHGQLFKIQRSEVNNASKFGMNVGNDMRTSTSMRNSIGIVLGIKISIGTQIFYWYQFSTSVDGNVYVRMNVDVTIVVDTLSVVLS